MRRGVFEGLQQRVESRLGEHVCLIDDVDLERPERGGEVYLLSQIADFVDASIRRRVNLDEIQSGSGRHFSTRLTLVAWLRRIATTSRAVQCLRHKASRRRLAGAAATAEQVCMRNARGDDGSLQRS